MFTYNVKIFESRLTTLLLLYSIKSSESLSYLSSFSILILIFFLLNFSFLLLTTLHYRAYSSHVHYETWDYIFLLFKGWNEDLFELFLYFYPKLFVLWFDRIGIKSSEYDHAFVSQFVLRYWCLTFNFISSQENIFRQRLCNLLCFSKPFKIWLLLSIISKSSLWWSLGVICIL